LGADALTAQDRAALKELAETLWDARREMAAEWSRRLIAVLPEYFSAGEITVEQLTDLNERFLGLVLTRLSEGNLEGLYDAYYRMNRLLIEADLHQRPANRISLISLYTSASISLQVLDERIDRDHDRLMVAYAKLCTQLMMLVGRAYSDSREEYLERVFEQINTLSHELRTPVTHLFSYLEMLRDGDFGPVSPEQEGVLDELMHETEDLLLLMTGTLELSRLDSGKVQLLIEEFDLHTIFEEVVRSTPRGNVSVTWSVPKDLAPLHNDRIKLKQIMGNLLRNAVRYGAGSPIALSAALAGPGKVTLSVRDRGPGIKPEEFAVIFEFLERGAAAALAHDGYGIGLHVVRRLVTLLDGTIEVESAPGQGACFRVTIPVVNRGAPPSVAGSAEGGRRRSVA